MMLYFTRLIDKHILMMLYFSRLIDKHILMMLHLTRLSHIPIENDVRHHQSW